jgi:hypothetical protein
VNELDHILDVHRRERELVDTAMTIVGATLYGLFLLVYWLVTQ